MAKLPLAYQIKNIVTSYMYVIFARVILFNDTMGISIRKLVITQQDAIACLDFQVMVII